MSAYIQQNNEENAGFLVLLEYNLQCRHALMSSEGCLTCWAYLLDNRDRLIPKMIETAVNTKTDGDDVVNRFVTGVHKRHLDGLALS